MAERDYERYKRDTGAEIDFKQILEIFGYHDGRRQQQGKWTE
jgi:hypothetical protein